MGKSMYNFGKQGKEKARQKKQLDKAAKRITAKQQKAKPPKGTPNAAPDIVEAGSTEEIGKSLSSAKYNFNRVS